MMEAIEETWVKVGRGRLEIRIAILTAGAGFRGAGIGPVGTS